MVMQQGDVLLVVSVSGVPQGCKRRGNLVLAEGEVTGHSHVAVGDDVELFEDEHGTLWLSAPQGARVTHQEHHEVMVPPGTYQVRKVREYDHFAEEARDVRD